MSSMIVMRCIAAVLALSGISVASAAPSFDCAKAGGWVENTICADAALGDLDRQLADRYASALEAADAAGKARLRDAQRAWAHGRADCEELMQPVECLARLYRTRIAELGGGDLPSWSSEVASAIAGIDACIAATPSVGIEVTGLQREGETVQVALRVRNGRGFACTTAPDGGGLVTLHDAKAQVAGPFFTRGAERPCPSAVPLGDSEVLGWMAPPNC